jgi:hypothetical protein
MNAAVEAGLVETARSKLIRPIFIVSTPRSGSTLLFESLCNAPGLFSTGSESHARIERVADFHPAKRGWTSNRLDETDVSDDATETLAGLFYSALRDRNGEAAPGPVRMLEKTPKNALRVPFFAAAWRDATFLYLYRDVRETLASMIEAWLSGRFRTYPALPGWTGHPWSLLLVPGWRDLIGRSLPEIVAHQWALATEIMLDDLEKLPAERVAAASYGDFVAAPQTTLQVLAERLDLEWDRQLPDQLPLSKYTVSEPGPDKWQRLEEFITPVLPLVERTDARAKAFVERFR